MNDANEKPKKSLPLRQKITALISIADRQSIFRSKTPHLPEIEAEKDRPCLLVIDDDAEFLETLEKKWQRHYRNALTLVTKKPDYKHSIVSWIEEELSSGMRLDAVFIDKNLASGGESSIGYLEDLSEKSLTKYLPIAVITTHEFETDESERRILLKYAECLIYRKRASPGFLYHMATSLPAMQDSAEDRKWTDLITKVGAWIADHDVNEDDVDIALFDVLNLFFENIFRLCAYFIGMMSEKDQLKLFQASKKPEKHFPENLGLNEFPLLQQLESEPLLINALQDNHIGQLEKLKHKPFLGCRLVYENRVLGVIVLLHSPGEAPFREKDKEFLKHLSLQLNYFLGWRSRALRNRRRQSLHVEFAESAASKNEVNDILDLLIEILHQEVNGNDDVHSKTSIRKLDQASGKILRYKRKGFDRKEAAITLDTQDSLYAEALRERKNLRYLDLEQEEPKHERFKGVHGSLTVPILSDVHVFGAVNLERGNSLKYDGNDELFVRTLCDLMGAAWMRIKQFHFQQQLVELLQSLWHDESFDSLQRRIYQYLQWFTGYALLLYLETDSSHLTGWQMKQIMDVDPVAKKIRPMPKVNADLWKIRISEQWDKTLIKEVLLTSDTKFRYVEGEEAKKYQLMEPLEASGEKLLIYAEAVIPIPAQDQKGPCIVLFFRLDKTLTPEQQALLQSFGLVIGDILHHLDQVKSLAERLKTAEAEAQLGFLYGQMRHVLNNQLGGIGNLLDGLEREGVAPEKLTLISNTLARLNTNLESLRFLVTEPRFENVELAPLWSSLQSQFEVSATYPARLKLGHLAFACYDTDKTILESILFNLILNAAQACELNKINCEVTLSSEFEKSEYRILIKDNGPGLSPEKITRIFEKNYTTRSDGTGFGLHFCRFQAERLGTRLSAENTGSGACFILTWREQIA